MEDTFSTTDLLLVAMLRTKDFQLEEWREISLSNGINKLEFFFKKSPEIEKEVQDFFKTDCYPFKKFYRELSELKALIHNH